MSKFKVGDKVRVIQDEGSGWSFNTKGKVYTAVATYTGFVFQHKKGEVSLTTLKTWPHEFELVEEEKEMHEFVNRKFRVKNAKHSRQIQEALFSLGYKWGAHGQKVMYTHANFLSTNESGYIFFGHSDSQQEFERDSRQEGILVARTSYSIEDVPQKAKPETVELNGLVYLKTDLEAALKKLTPVGGGK